MMYYRLALQERQAVTWVWKSNPLTSLSAVLQLLRIYSFVPQDRMRVFASASRVGLDDMLNRENNGTVSGSVTVTEFLRARNMHVYGLVQSMQDRKALEMLEDRGSATNANNVTRQLLPLSITVCEGEDMTTTGSSENHVTNVFDRKRLEIEQGAGGDHDVPYTFALPIVAPQMRVWTSLLSRVQAGQLPV